MYQNNRSSRNIIILLMFLLLGVGLYQLGYWQTIQGSVRSLTQPAQILVSNILVNLRRNATERENVDRLTTEIRILEDELNRQTVENIRLSELEQENRRLRQMLNYTENNPDLGFVTSQVLGQAIGSDISNLTFSIFINVGTRDGVANDMPVVTHRGLVGRIWNAAPNVSQVLLLIDPTSSVNAVIQTSRLHGIVNGQIEVETGSTLLMERLSQGASIAPGDMVLTSGLGGKFPDKLVIGQVTEVFQRELDLFQTARIRPTVDFANIEEVIVLTSFERVDIEDELRQETEDEN